MLSGYKFNRPAWGKKTQTKVSMPVLYFMEGPGCCPYSQKFPGVFWRYHQSSPELSRWESRSTETKKWIIGYLYFTWFNPVSSSARVRLMVFLMQGRWLARTASWFRRWLTSPVWFGFVLSLRTTKNHQRQRQQLLMRSVGRESCVVLLH